ncbi:MAG: hypothetical protein FWD57_16680, partial [Polyangiaceae bacterium]|nr:hypothetical protein [Polyangiaceae bacterium]
MMRKTKRRGLLPIIGTTRAKCQMLETTISSGQPGLALGLLGLMGSIALIAIGCDPRDAVDKRGGQPTDSEGGGHDVLAQSQPGQLRGPVRRIPEGVLSPIMDQCPAGMAFIPTQRFCIHRWEAQVHKRDGTVHDPYQVVPYPDMMDGMYAKSLPGVVPQGYVGRDQA